MIDEKSKAFLYPDGIYVRHSNNDYSYLQKVANIQLSNYSELVPLLETDRPEDKFKSILNTTNYIQYHKVPWKQISNIMGIAYQIFEQKSFNKDKQTSNILSIFLFQKMSDKSQYITNAQGQKVLDNQDTFCIVVPKQALNNNLQAMDDISQDTELQQYLKDPEFTYVGQFIFLEYNPYATDIANKNIHIALHNMPQNVYVFNDFGAINANTATFNFYSGFGALQRIPVFDGASNQDLVQKDLSPKDVYQYISVPIAVKKPDEKVSINNDIDNNDFVLESTYVYANANISLSRLSSRLSTEFVNQFLSKPYFDLNNNDNTYSETTVTDNNNNEYQESASNENDTVNNDIPVEAEQTQQQEQNQVSQGDFVNNDTQASDDDTLSPIMDKNVSQNNNSSAATSDNNDVNNKLSKAASDTLAAITDDNVNNQNNNGHITDQDIIDNMPADQRLVEDGQGHSVYFAPTPHEHSQQPDSGYVENPDDNMDMPHSNQASQDKHGQAVQHYIENNVSQQNQDFKDNASPELNEALSKLLKNN